MFHFTANFYSEKNAEKFFFSNILTGNVLGNSILVNLLNLDP